MSKFDDYLLGKIDSSDPWVAHGLQMGWLEPKAAPTAPEPRRKTFGFGEQKPVDTRTFQQYDPSNPLAKKQLTPVAEEISDFASGMVAPVLQPAKAAFGDPEAQQELLSRVAPWKGKPDQMYLGIFAGVKAKGAPLGALKTAKEMAAKGIPDQQIWAETGWTKGFPDKQWRWEISDADMNIKAPLEGTVGKAIEHGQLYSAHPDIADITYDWYPFEQSKAGSYSRSSNRITASGRGKATPLHELQHAVQEREGFARGGSPSMFNANSALDVEKYNQSLRKNLEVDSGLEANKQALSDAGYNVGAMSLRDLEMTRAKLLKELREGRRINPPDPMAQYQSLAGEAESRLTQKRMDLTPEQRRAQYPIDQFDVPPEQQIVRGVSGAVEEAYRKMRGPKSKAMLKKRYPELGD